MTIEPIVFYDLVIIAFVLGLGLVVLIVFYAQVLNKLHLMQKDEEKLKQQINKKGEEVLDRAREKAEEVITEAVDKAQEILGSAALFNEKAKSILDRKLESVSKNQAGMLERSSLDLLKDYEKAIEELKQDNINLFRNISKNIETYASQELKDFKDTLQKETVDSQKIVEQKIEEEFKKAEDDLKTYKLEQLKKIDESIFLLLHNISEMTIGKILNFEQHEELIIEALEKAKRNLAS